MSQDKLYEPFPWSIHFPIALREQVPVIELELQLDEIRIDLCDRNPSSPMKEAEHVLYGFAALLASGGTQSLFRRLQSTSS